jgi:hypothetical protein
VVGGAPAVRLALEAEREDAPPGVDFEKSVWAGNY